MTTPDAVLGQARRWLGTAEQPDGSNRVPGITDWYGLVGPWCAMFVSRCFYDAGLVLPFDTPKGFAWTPSGVLGFKRGGRWTDGRAGIAPGDVVFYSWSDPRFPVDHVEIVESVRADGSFVTIGGNVGNRVGRFVRSSCVGHGRPAWSAAAPPAPTPTPTPAPAPPPAGARLHRPTIPPFLRCVPLGRDFRPRPGVRYSAAAGTGGPEVWHLQNALRVFDPTLAADGAFGWETHVRVWNFQKVWGLSTDGVYGPATATVLDWALTLHGR